MSNSNYYFPIPPRAWNRVQKKCIYENSSNLENNDYIQDPIISYRVALIKKGNVLQYKNNSSNLTKKQKYSQIAKGLWQNRTKTWATQSDIYTNPNTTSLKRVGYTEYPINDITPGSPANISGPYNTVDFIDDPFNCPNLTFKDGGSLVCSTYENPCTGKIIEQNLQPKYYPTTDSNVPGPIQYLYWDPKIQTWYPKVQRIMNNSTNKWPENYKFFKSAIYPVAPILYLVSSTVNSVTLSWSINQNNCYPISKFNIFINNNLNKTITFSNSNTTIINGLNSGPYDIYIVAIIGENSSPPSNIIQYNNQVYP